MKVLIVEDEQALSMVLKEEFASLDFNVKVAQDGEESIQLVETFKPDIIMLDLILPKKGGLEVLAELKAKAEFRTLPVIILSNLAEDASIQKAMEMGATDYFVKTQHSIEEVVQKTRNYLKK